MRSGRYPWLYCLLFVFWLSCEKDDQQAEMQYPDNEEPAPVGESTEADAFPRTGDSGQILVHSPEKAHPGYVMVNDAGANRVYLMTKATGSIVYEWDLDSGIGNDVELLPDGRILASLAVDDPPFSFGGYGGKVKLIGPEGTVTWDYTVASDRQLAHHDVEILPNGNVLIMVWDARPYEEAVAKGYSSDQPYVYTERLIEVDPRTDKIMWEWDSWDHLIQDADPTAEDYGTVSQHPERIDVNFVDQLRKEIAEDGDIMHANGLDYDSGKDVVYLSVNYFSEVWVIDHSTTTEEARTSSGGNYGKGGDLVHRFGNPSAYGNPEGRRLFYYNHFPNLLEEGEPGEGNMLIYVNRGEADLQSTVYELDLPGDFNLLPGADNEPAVVWEFTDEALFSPKVSGAVRLENGNTLITCGVFGFWEVTPQKEVVWQFRGEGFFWRGYHYNLNDPAVLNYVP